MSTVTLSKPIRRVQVHTGAGRPDLHNITAHPARRAGGVSRGNSSSCIVERRAVTRDGNPVVHPWVRCKALALAVIAVVGGVVGVTGYVAAVSDAFAETSAAVEVAENPGMW